MVEIIKKENLIANENVLRSQYLITLSIDDSSTNHICRRIQFHENTNL